MKSRFCSLSAAWVLTLAGTANAVTLVDVGPSAGTSVRVGGPANQVETVSWTQTEAYSGVNISVLAGNLGETNTFGVLAYLTTDIGAGAPAPLASAGVTMPIFASEASITPTSLFVGLALAPGTYYLTLFHPDTTGVVNMRWASGASATFGAGVTPNGEFFANTSNGVPNSSSPWESTFVMSSAYDLGFSVIGTPVPEAASVALLGVGLFTVLLTARRRI